jgi:hypothetical protein
MTVSRDAILQSYRLAAELLDRLVPWIAWIAWIAVPLGRALLL